MALQFSTTVRNALLDAMESGAQVGQTTAIGASPLLRFYAGTKPADCATAAAGTKCAEAALPSDWLANASGGSKSKSGTWQDLSADATGTVSYFRIYDSTGTTCHSQGDVTATGGGGDMEVDSVSFVAGQTVTVTSFTWTAPGA